MTNAVDFANVVTGLQCQKLKIKLKNNNAKICFSVNFSYCIYTYVFVATWLLI